jgi:hypothetical protein
MRLSTVFHKTGSWINAFRKYDVALFHRVALDFRTNERAINEGNVKQARFHQRPSHFSCQRIMRKGSLSLEPFV